MAADIKQNDFLGGNHKRQGNTKTVRLTARSFEFAAQGMQLQMTLKRVYLEITQDPAETRFKIRVLLEKFPSLTKKLMRCDNGVHYSVSSVSRAFSRSAAVLKVFTFPPFTSDKAARTRA